MASVRALVVAIVVGVAATEVAVAFCSGVGVGFAGDVMVAVGRMFGGSIPPTMGVGVGGRMTLVGVGVGTIFGVGVGIGTFVGTGVAGIVVGVGAGVGVVTTGVDVDVEVNVGSGSSNMCVGSAAVDGICVAACVTLR